jgi:hypothetical protein
VARIKLHYDRLQSSQSFAHINDRQSNQPQKHRMVWPFSSSDSTTTKPDQQKEGNVSVTKEQALAMSNYDREVRRRRLMGAINENCALASFALLDCQDSWNLWNKVTLCQSFQKNYVDCLNTQRVLYLDSRSY